MKYRKMLLALALMAAGLLAVSCGDNDAEQPLTILYWQAPTIANPYHSSGSKDVDASALVLEPLANYNEKGELLPRLSEEVPTVENGGVSEDMTMMTWKLKEGIYWSDGTPLSVEDVVFTHRYICSLPSIGNACDPIQSVDSADDSPLNIKITFTSPTPYPYIFFVGAGSPVLQKAQFDNCVGKAASECRNENLYPVGTGPYKITDFTVNESETETTSSIIYEVNEHFRAPEELFSKVVLKGGGDAITAARAVLETGEADYGWNIQIDPQTLESLQKAGRGRIETAFSASVEHLVVNFTNPDSDLGNRRSEWSNGNNPHPFLTDPAVRQALSLAIDRGRIAEQLYGPAGRPACNILSAPQQYASPNNESCLTQDIGRAKALLDDAGWLPGDDGIRKKGEVRLEILYQTSTNLVRQMTQKMIQQWWREIGVETELKDIDAGVFFGNNAPGIPDTLGRFRADIQMYASGASIDPQSYMSSWQTSQIAGAENNWMGGNVPRWSSKEYDSLYKKLEEAPIGTAREELVIQLNDLLVQNHVLIPLINRGFVSVLANSLKGVRANDWDSDLWNIHEWYRE